MDEIKEISNNLNLIMVELRQLNFFLERIGDLMVSEHTEEKK